MRRAAKTDRNQTQIVTELRQMGYSVFPTHAIGKGFPDLVIGKHGISLLVELKMPREKLTPDEVTFFETWCGSAVVACSTEQVHAAFERLETK